MKNDQYLYKNYMGNCTLGLCKYASLKKICVESTVLFGWTAGFFFCCCCCLWWIKNCRANKIAQKKNNRNKSIAFDLITIRFCLLPRSQFPLKPHSNMSGIISIWWEKLHTHHSQCMEFLMQFWWMTIFSVKKMYGYAFLVGCVCDIQHGFMPKFWLTHSKNRKNPETDFSLSTAMIDGGDAILKLWWRAFFYVCYLLIKQLPRAGRAIKKIYIYLLNFINENYQY